MKYSIIFDDICNFDEIDFVLGIIVIIKVVIYFKYYSKVKLL